MYCGFQVNFILTGVTSHSNSCLASSIERTVPESISMCVRIYQVKGMTRQMFTNNLLNNELSRIDYLYFSFTSLFENSVYL